MTEYDRGFNNGSKWATRVLQLDLPCYVQDEVGVVESNLHAHSDAQYRQGWADGAKAELCDYKALHGHTNSQLWAPENTP